MKKYRLLRYARIALSVTIMLVAGVAVGLGHHMFLSDWQLIPALLASGAEWVMLWAIVTALWGRIYCSTVCPLGTLQDFLARLNPRRSGYFYAPAAPAVRWLMVMAIIVAAVLGLSVIVSALDPAARFDSLPQAARELIVSGSISLGGAIGAGATLAVVAFFAIRRGRLLCNTLCPVGTVLGAFSRYSLYQIDINTDKCVGCGRCTERCKAQCIDPRSHTVDVSRCVVCFDCVADCPNDAITFRRGRHQLQLPLMQETPSPATNCTTK